MNGSPLLSFSECPLCGGKGFFRREVGPDDPHFGRPVPCAGERHTEARLKRLGRLWDDYDEQDQAIRLADVAPNPDNQEMVAAAAAFLARPRGWLYIHGGPGNAKTVILKALINELNLVGAGPARYIKFSKILNYIRDWKNSRYTERFENLKRIPVLGIDEFDKARMTEFAAEFRFDFLDDRYDQAIKEQTALIFASQEPPDSLSVPLASRLKDGRFVVVHNLAGDARPAEEWPDD